MGCQKGGDSRCEDAELVYSISFMSGPVSSERWISLKLESERHLRFLRAIVQQISNSILGNFHEHILE